MSKQLPSKVLLVCIYDTVVFELTNQIIFNTFRQSAPVKKILIFQRGQVTKTFVQFFTQEEATKILLEFDGKKMFESYCKMHIYYSNLKQIDLKNQYSKGKDFSSTSSSIISERIHETSFEDFSPKFQNQYQQLKRYKSTDNKQLVKAIDYLNYQDQLHERIKSDIIQNILQDDTPKKGTVYNQGVFSTWNNVQTNFSVNEMESLYYSNDHKTRILTFNYENPITIKQVYNLFSNFGNIQQIIKKTDLCFIEFSNIEFAAIAKDYLNNTVLYGNIIRLNYCEQKQIIQKPRQYRQSIIYDTSFFRFNSKKSISINPPANTLHVSNIKKEFCTETKLRNLFSEFGNVEKVSILLQSKEKNMALVKMSRIEDSFNAIADLHNHEILGRKLQISFTKSKI